MRTRSTNEGVIVSPVVYNALTDARQPDIARRVQNANEQLEKIYGPAIRLFESPAVAFIAGAK